MKYIKYFFQFILIKLFFLIFKLIGYKNASNLGGLIGSKIGPIFKSKKIIKNNLKNYLPDIDDQIIEDIINKMWENYGRIFAEYMFIKDFRSTKLEKNLKIIGIEYLEEIKKNKKPVIFVSGHFNNFELMAMLIEKSGINLAAVYRPLNNIFLNITMEKIRKNFICKNQIKKGISGLREILTFFKKNTSVAIMIDQRVTEGIKCNFFNKPAYTTTIPAQLIKKFNCPIVTVYIERKNKINFEITINKPIYFEKNDDSKKITKNLNLWLEKMISKNPEQWIWTHNRWKL
jgi:KDO2-lipid IV(A) lauroyltransferase